MAIAIGANLSGPFGSPLQSCRRAVDEIAASTGLRPMALSDWYDTEPVPKSMQPNFVNGVALFSSPEGGLVDPALLLETLGAIEAAAGRLRSVPDAARPLDLDIVAIGTLVRSAPDPVLPHPRAHRRRFVLLPLRDVWPGWRHPVLGLSIEAMLATAPAERIRRLADGEGD